MTTQTTTTTNAGAGAGASAAGATGDAGVGAKPSGEAAGTSGATSLLTAETPKGAEGTQKGDPAKANESAPAELKVTLPDGMQADEGLMKEVLPWAKESGLKQEGLDKLVGFYSKAQTAAAEAQSKAAAEAHQKQVAEWVAASKASKDFGGADFEKNLLGAQSALKRFGSPELTQLLAQSGLGNHPLIIGLLHGVSKAIAEDSTGSGGDRSASASTEEAQYQAFYPKTYEQMKGGR